MIGIFTVLSVSIWSEADGTDKNLLLNISAVTSPIQLSDPRLGHMENLISLVNRLQRACTALGDHGEERALPTLWDAFPSIAVVSGLIVAST
ncbi:hypothetical protein RJ639_045932 [Escallonia herrerae]|uniref:Uncharacterized protein n=1 Tax=Escallonia herrerae TaxID=1293975 RepID=A0AA88W9Q5_9ASTE|nr:hypothetical protein RJ639_045932 [Escallonia herrerae]